jgi:uncharacterized protein (TIGR00725 family)
MKRHKAIQIGVLGPAGADDTIAGFAERVGELIALGGATLVCGGLGGAMEAAARGAFKAGGLTIGILPGPEPADANRYIKAVVATDMGHARNALVVRSSDAVIAIGGGYGTLSEIALAMKCGVPVVGLATWRASRGDELKAPIIAAGGPEEAVEMALSEARKRTRRQGAQHR